MVGRSFRTTSNQTNRGKPGNCGQGKMQVILFFFSCTLTINNRVRRRHDILLVSTFYYNIIFMVVYRLKMPKNKKLINTKTIIMEPR